MKVFRLLENNKVEYAEFSGKYNTTVWKDITLVDTYTVAIETINGEVVERVVYPLFVKLENNRYVPDLLKIQEEEDAQALEDAQVARKQAMLDGSVYTLNGKDYTISFTADDGNGMIQVKTSFDMGLTSTVIHFDSGAKVPITTAEFGEFASWFIAKRNEFF